VHHSDLEHAIHGAGNRHCVAGVAVEEVGRAVQGVDHPDQSVGDDLRAQLFAYNCGWSTAVLQYLRDDSFRLAVDLGDVVTPTFEGPAGRAVRPLDAPKICRRLLRGRLGSVQ
jgi:hypothetical protein